jgi:hypothetical protein
MIDCKKCKHGHDRSGRETVQMCAEHQSEHDATRKRWAEDYRRSQSDAGVEHD